MPKRKYDCAEVKAEMNKWGKEPALVNLSEDDQTLLRSRILALKMYSEGFDTKEIQIRTGINRTSIARLLEKGMKQDELGRPYGYAALIPFTRTSKVKKNKLQDVFDRYEGLEGKIISFYFSLEQGRSMKRPDKKSTHELFIAELTKRGHDTDSYPFTSEDCGLRTFSRWLDIKEEEKMLFLARQTKEAKTENDKTSADSRIVHASRPYEVVEIDGHRLDLIYVVSVTDQNGHEHLIPTERPWLLAAIDVATRAILSYRIVFNSEYSSIDVMKLIEGITVPFETIDGIRSDGMPSQVFEEARYALPELIMLDNALAHYANDVLDKTTDYGYQFCYGPVADPTKRPHIERFFNTFETRWGHKIPSTTGSNVSDPIRIEAEKDAVRFHFDRMNVKLLVDLAIATYNNTAHRSLSGMTPIGMMRKLLNQGFIPNRLSLSNRSCFKLYCKRKAVLRGNKKSGKHVYVQIMNFRYSSDSIERNYNLIGEKVTLLIDPDNINVIYAYNFKDIFLGPLYIKGHNITSTGGVSMKQGKDIHKFLREHGIKPSHSLDDVKRYIMELEKSPGNKGNVRKMENIKVNLPEVLNTQIDEEKIPEQKEMSKSRDGYFDADRSNEKNLSFDERSMEERREALRNKYARKHYDQ